MSLRVLVGSVIGYTTAALFNSVLFVLKESYEGVYLWLKDTFGHHWVGHGIVTLAVFIIVSLIGMSLFKGEELEDNLASKMIASVVTSTILSLLIIMGFLLIHM
ncbi:MAG: hypothetical protein GSR79_03355 [Desulfurococcales archaeon]|nr:hypothetical protein [Desulfurococcales archaeon]